ncbi:hypothetical protein SAMN05216503_1838 [Polaribacter sp. KT25b]|uniref:hypothetical protein n=1 Tax=Polaribacter sp. KT25b TaxID=1855336 RepID=UPI00087B4615|nr:hypothetical protein [Polaribacter sp. KT25b]SDS05647.1 hypothetical protein SAMN05216503_1838 [Polaribacter sp. KT25b]
MKKTNFKNLDPKEYACIHNKIGKRTYLNRPSEPEEQEILYRLYSPRVQLLDNIKNGNSYISIEYLSAGSKKISNIKCEFKDNILSIIIDINALNNNGNDKNTMSHIVFNVSETCKDLITKEDSIDKITVLLQNNNKLKAESLTENLLIIKGTTTITDPYEEYPPFAPTSISLGEYPIEEEEK